MDKNISIKEKKMYDRQIRVWGIEAQKRLRNSSVLVIGVECLSAELCKNIVLSGIGKLTLCDLDNTKTISEFDVNSVFCYTKEQIGKLRVEALKEFLTELNPNVEIKFETKNINQVENSFFEDFDVICLTESPIIFQLKLNKIARELNKIFFSGDVLGNSGLIFSDLTEKFNYTLKEEKCSLKFNSLASSLTCKLDCFNKRQNKEKVFFSIVKAIYSFEGNNDKLPSENDAKEVLDIAKKSDYLTNEESILCEDFLIKLLAKMAKKSPAVAAIIGGILGQEVIKSISRNIKPFKNWLLFSDCLKGAAVVVDIAEV